MFFFIIIVGLKFVCLFVIAQKTCRSLYQLAVYGWQFAVGSFQLAVANP